MKKIVLFFVAMVVSLAIFAQEAAPVEVTTMDELKAHAGELVLYKGLELVKVEVEPDPMDPWGQVTYKYYMPDKETEFVYAVAAQLAPAKVDASGTYNAETKTFEVDIIEAYYSFFTWSGFNMYMMYFGSSLAEPTPFVVKEAVPVIFVSSRGNLLAIQVQMDLYGLGMPMTVGLQVECKPGQFRNGMPNIDDVWCNVEGIFTPMNMEEGTIMKLELISFEVSEEEVVASYEKVDAAMMNAFKVETNSFFYNASAIELNPTGGKIVAKSITEGEGEEAFTYNEYYYSNGKDSTLITLYGTTAADIDLTQYVDKNLEFAPRGVYFHETKSIALTHCEYVDNTNYYENIASLVQGTSVVGLKNPVMLNYIFKTSSSLYLFVEDATGTLLVQGDLQDLNVEIGDSIVGLKGTFWEGKLWYGEGYDIPMLSVEKVNDGICNINEDITLGDIIADYAGTKELNYTIVRLTNLETKAVPNTNNDYYLIQGEDTIKINKYYWKKSTGLEVPPAKIAELTAIVDYSGATLAKGNPELNVHPLDAESIVVKEEIIEVTTMEELKANAGKRVLYKGLELIRMGRGYMLSDYETMVISTLPTPYADVIDAIGTYKLVGEGEEQYGEYELESIESIVGFKTLENLKGYYELFTEEQKAQYYQITEPIVVSSLLMQGIAVQYYNSGYCLMGNTMMLEETPVAGDKIKVSVKFDPEIKEDGKLIKPETFNFDPFTLEIESKNNPLEYTQIATNEIENSLYKCNMQILCQLIL